MITAERIAQSHQGNVDALIRAGQIWASGVQDLSSHVAKQAHSSMEEMAFTFRAMIGVTSLKDAIDLQNSHTRTALETALDQGRKLTETGLKLAENTAAPLAARVHAAVEVFTQPA